MLSSFLSKLSRWGFRRVPNIRSDYYEFCLPTFKRLGVDSAPASATAGKGDSTRVQQQQIQQVVDRMNLGNPAPTQSNASHAFAHFISNIQRQHSSQQPSMSSQQPILDQNVDANSYLQSFQQWQWHHSNPTMNTLNTNRSSPFAGYFSSLPQNSAMNVNALMSHSGTLPNNNATPAMSQPNDIAVLHPLVMMMQRVVEEELQRRNQVDHILNTMMLMFGQIISDRGSPNDNIVQSQQGMIPLLIQSLASNNSNRVGALPPSLAAILQATGWGASTQLSGNMQADSIASILQSARTSEAAGEGLPDEHAHARNDMDNEDNGDDDDDDGEDGGVDGHLSPRKGESPDDDDQSYADDDSWEKKLRSRK